MRAAKTWPLWQILLLLAAIVLLPVLLAGGWAVRSAMEQHRAEVERSALDLSRALSIAVGTELESNIAALRTLAQSPALSGGDIAAFYAIALRTQRSTPHWKSIVLADAQGRPLFSTSRPYGGGEPVVVDPDSLAKTLKSGTPMVGSVLTGPGGNPAFPVRLPVMRDGRLTYILSAAVLPDRMLDIVQRQKVSPDWVVAVFDGAGRRVARSREHSGSNASPSLQQLMAGGAGEGTGTTTTLEGVEALTAFNRIRGHHWAVAVGIPAAVLKSGLLTSIGLYLAGLLGSIALCSLAAAWLSRRVARSIDSLRDQAVHLVRGKASLARLDSRIREVNEVDEALISLSRERMAIEDERARLVASLNEALIETRNALTRAEEAGRAKDLFLAMIGHELRNPLAPIVSALDLMELRGDDRTERERAILRRQVDHLRRLVDDLLDVARIAQGKLEIRREPVDLKELATQACEGVRQVAREGGVRLELDTPDAPLWVSGDPARIMQAVTNLLANALRFTKGGRVRLAVARDAGQAAIVVEDDGEGMDTETLDQAFQPFFQAPQAIARTRGGLGLGLAIVRSIVELHGGSVRALSDGAGKGSCFQILLPLGEQAAAPRPAEADPLVARKRILVVDDNVDAADLVSAGLSVAGHEVRTVHEAREALALLGTFQPDVAILDIGMPGMDGYQLAQAMRADCHGRPLKLIALSGYGQAVDKQRARGAGFDRHVTKPASIGELNRVLRGM